MQKGGGSPPKRSKANEGAEEELATVSLRGLRPLDMSLSLFFAKRATCREAMLGLKPGAFRGKFRSRSRCIAKQCNPNGIFDEIMAKAGRLGLERTKKDL